MIRFIQRFLVAFKDTLLRYRYDAFADSEEGWSSEDSKHLAAFIQSTTGERLLARMKNFAVRSATLATDFKQDFLYHAGVAHGIRLQQQFIEQHMDESGFRQALVANTEQSEPSPIHPGVREFALR